MVQLFPARPARIPSSQALGAAAVGRRLKARGNLVRWAFVALVVAPTLAALVYTSLLATPRFVSEAQFVVRGLSTSRATGLDALFRTFGISRAVDDANIVQSFILSRDAVRALEERMPAREMFARSQIDLFARYPRFWQTDNDERFFRYYLDRVSVVQDGVKGISTLKVVAFRADEAQKIAQTLLALAEGVVNRLNMRAETDTVVAAEKQVALAERNVMATQATLTAFRNKNMLVDPTKSSESQLETITSLATQSAQTSAAIMEQARNAGSNPTIEGLRARAASLEDQIATERRKLAGSDGALAAQVSQYEKLALDRDLAGKTLSSAMQSLEAAREDARRQLIYVEPVVSPHLPDSATEPDVLRATMTSLVLGFAVFGVVWILSVGAQEHQQ